MRIKLLSMALKLTYRCNLAISVQSTIKIAHLSCYTHFSATAEQKSPSIFLESGKFYELVATLKEYKVNDYITVAVELPSGKFLAPIPSEQLFVGKLTRV